MFISKKNIEIILDRKEVNLLGENSLDFKNKTIVVLGAAGSIATVL